MSLQKQRDRSPQVQDPFNIVPLYFKSVNSCVNSILYLQLTINMYYFFCPNLFNFDSNSWMNSNTDSSEPCSTVRENGILVEPKITFSPTILQNPSSTINEEEASSKETTGFRLQKPNSTSKRQCQDGDYNPNFEKPLVCKKTKQLENRNVVPNIIRLILSFVQKPGKSSKLVQSFLQRQGNPKTTSKRFFLYHKLVKSKMNNYVNEQSLVELIKMRTDSYDVYNIQEQMCYRMVSRKLVLYYLNHEALSCILNSRRIERSKKWEHVAAIRAIIERLKITFQQ